MSDINTAEERLGAESAYPLPAGTTQVNRWQAGYGEYRVTEAVSTSGLTKRELFAIHMMASICTTHSGGSINATDSDLEYLSQKAVRSADVLLQELAK
jgi:hypothetical protein